MRVEILRFMSPANVAKTALGLVGFTLAYFTMSQFWWLFLTVGVMFIGASFFIPNVSSAMERDAMNEREFLIPKNWDPEEVGIQFRSLKRKPDVLRTFVDSVVTRFVIGQDELVAQKRIAFLRTKLEELELSKDIQSSLDDLEFRNTNLEIKRIQFGLEKDGLEAKRAKQKELSDLEHQRDTLKIKLEMAALEKQMRDFQDPKFKEPERSPAEVKKEKRDKLQKELDRWNGEEDRIKADTAMREDDRRRWLNMIAKKKDELYEQIEKAL
jgi:hypothetical protein